MNGLSIGIDYSTYAASLVSLPIDGPIGAVRRRVVKFRPASRSGNDEMVATLAVVRNEIISGLAGLTTDLSTAVVWIERGYGASRRSDWAMGAYFAAIYAACSSLPLGGLNPLDAREWKQIVTLSAGIGLVKDGTRGNANAPKEVANEACRGLLALGEVDAADWSADDLDAFGIAYAGRDLNRSALVTV